MQSASLRAEIPALTGQPAIKVYRDHYGIVARTEGPLFGDFILEVYTRKGVSGVLTTRATVHKVEGSAKVHRVYEDYSRCVFKTEHKRITEKLVAGQQAEAVKVWDTLKAEATAHTQAAEARRAAS